MDNGQLFAGWRVERLGDVCEVISGQSPQGKFYNDTGTGTPFYQGKKEFGDKFIGRPKKWTSHITKMACLDDILMSVRAPVGPINFATQNLCIGRGLAAIRTGVKIDKDFLYYQLLSKQREISGNEGAVFASINKKQIESIELNLPPLPEQKRIIAILDEAFAGISLAVANAEKNLANAHELFESYLNNVFTQKGDAVLVKLSDIATDITDGDHSAPPKSSEGIPFITISNVNKKTRLIDFTNTFKVPEEYFNNLKLNRKPKFGDVLYTVTGSYGIPIKVPEGVDFCFQRHIGLLRPNEKIHSSWLYYALLSPMVFKQATEGATGTAQKTVSLRVLRSVRVPLMNWEKQEDVVKQLDKMWVKTQHLETIYQQKLTALNELKQSILQKAFTGQLTSTIDNG